jgi:pyridoxal phosphate enzyme (YggS family)
MHRENAATVAIMDSLENNLQGVKTRIAAAAQACGRPVCDIVLVAISKSQPADMIRAAFAAGQRDFGESYVQEALDKMQTLADLAITWHFVGPIQSNKTRALAQAFDWVHSIDREKIALRLSAHRPQTCPPLNVCVQVNVSGEATKSGVAVDGAATLAHAVAKLPGLRLRGLMAIPEPGGERATQRTRFAELARLKQQLVADGLGLDTLSLGMSDDLEAAIAAGSTMLRVGTAIFGARVTATA